MREFNEPWEFIQRPADKTYGEEIATEIVDAEGCVILGLRDEDDPKFIQRLERIAACVNACAGIPTEALDPIRQCAPSLTINLTPEIKAELQQALADANQSQIITLPAAVQYSPAPLTWRKEPPNKPGFYWLLEAGRRPLIVEVRQLFVSETLFAGPLEAQWFAMESDRMKAAQWAGPIEPPEAPR